MEPEAALRTFRGSQEKLKMRYVTMISDDDSKCYKTIPEAEDLYDVRKEECINHVGKRMFHGLESVKKRYKGSQTLGCKGKLTEDLMRRFQSLYSKSIRDYCNGVCDGSRVADLSDLQRDIKAGLHHTISSDGYPDHDICPTGPETWCQYNQHVLRNTLEDYSKPVPLLPRWIGETLIPLFDRLSGEFITVHYLTPS